MKTDNEIKESIFERRDKYLIQKKSRSKKIIAAAACFIIIAAGITGITAYLRNGSISDSGTDSSGGIPAKINTDDFKIREYDEVLTDEEIDAYYAENKISILSGLSASGVNVSGAELSEKGYSHIKIEETEITLRSSFRDRLLYNGNKLVAIITFVKENNRIYSTPSFGGTWYDTFADFLSKHRGERLTFCYLGYLEFIVGENGEILSPSGYAPDVLTRELGNKIAEANCEKAIYIP